MNLDKTKALVILSGGQDSATCLFWAMEKWGTENVQAVTFNYGQRHKVELECAAELASSVGIQQHLLDVHTLGAISTSALTGAGAVAASSAINKSLPASFVPNRNGMFVTMAHALAITLGYGNLVGGMCQTDYSGYPDCREEFLQPFVQLLNHGNGLHHEELELHTPLMFLTKAETWAMAEELGDDVLRTVVNGTHTCYEGDHTTLHPWGYGCGVCPACQLRAKGWDTYAEGMANG